MANVVLVHGAWCDGSSWSEVTPLLQEAGRNVIAVQNPMTSVAADVANTRAVLDQLEGPTALAGHSYGGTVIAGCAADNVTGLVFVDAIANDEGESVNDILGCFPKADIPSLIRVDEHSLMTVDRDAFPEVIAGDVEHSRGAVMSAVQKPTSTACFGDALAGPPAWRSVPSTFLVSEHDRTVHPDAQRFMAARIGGKTITLPSSHASLVSHPREVADAILSAAA